MGNSEDSGEHVSLDEVSSDDDSVNSLEEYYNSIFDSKLSSSTTLGSVDNFCKTAMQLLPSPRIKHFVKSPDTARSYRMSDTSIKNKDYSNGTVLPDCSSGLSRIMPPSPPPPPQSPPPPRSISSNSYTPSLSPIQSSRTQSDRSSLSLSSVRTPPPPPPPRICQSERRYIHSFNKNPTIPQTARISHLSPSSSNIIDEPLLNQIKKYFFGTFDDQTNKSIFLKSVENHIKYAGGKTFLEKLKNIQNLDKNYFEDDLSKRKI
eukprot:GHVL01011924.1.p2 GENE.GHVL01011924.1~~GHVL01011924.1.p2  ORF type:complete len:262 (+),score=76.22 GHVL01011924.1:240-1025(+)